MNAVERPAAQVRFRRRHLLLFLVSLAGTFLIGSTTQMAGVASLFTREAFQEMRRATRPGGVVCQWVQGYLLAEERFRTVLRTWLHLS